MTTNIFDRVHFIYRTTCITTGRFYIGMHSTKDIDDGYVGSGKFLKRSISKYGINNHTFTILEFCDTREELCEREKCYITVNLLNDKMCMNLTLGGHGSYYHINISEAHKERGREKIKVVNGNLTAEDRSKLSTKSAQTMKARGIKPFNNMRDACDWRGRTHREETKKKISAANAISQAGERNSNFGNCWVKNENHTIRIKKEELPNYLFLGYSEGRDLGQSGIWCWVNDGKNDLKIKKETLNDYLTNGFIRGKMQTGKCYVFKENTCIFISKEMLSEYLLNGYSEGRLWKTRKVNR